MTPIRRAALETLESRRLLATITVNSLDGGTDPDPNTTTLREALALAADNVTYPGADTIDLTGLSGTIHLASELTLDSDVTLDGPGADTLTISGDDAVGNSNNTRLLNQTAGNVTVRGLTLTKANYSGGNGRGAAFNTEAGTAVLDGLRIHDNASTGGNTGIVTSWDGGDLTIRNTSVTGNTATYSSPGAPFGIVVILASNVVVDNVTIAGNTLNGAPNISDGTMLNVANGGFATSHRIAVERVTVTSNNAPGSQAAAVRIRADASYGPSTVVTVRDNLVAGNAVTGSNELVFFFNSDGLPSNTYTFENNLIGAGLNYTVMGETGVSDGERGNQIGTAAAPIDARLGTLAGGVVPLLAGSPAIDAGSASAATLDQRGFRRVGAADIGAFEFNGFRNAVPTFATTDPLPIAVPGVPFSFDFAATDGDANDALTLTATGVPSWVTFTDHGDGTATLAGTPGTGETLGASSLRVSATDTYDTASLDRGLILGRKAAQVVKGELAILGTSGDDVIDVGKVRGKLRVTRNGEHRFFKPNEVKTVRVLTNGGNDDVTVNHGQFAIVELGDGDDTFTGRAINHHVFAGAGADTVTLARGRNIVFAGDGNDTVLGGSGKDKLYGEGGNDVLTGGGGPNVLGGGAGDDTLNGGNSADRLYGHEGDDFLNGRRGGDRLYGGADNDSAYRDAADLVDGVETFV